ncbi:MAG TPA: glycosyltransferase [Streptosporangiaceae bacterium]|nr:glycosyltransferase [Streptosporangiaceae bacterium]
MSRFLFVILPLPGHINPAAAVARNLAEHGHEVAWVGSEARFRPLIGPDAAMFPTGMRPYRGQADTGMTSVKSLWESFVVPFARFILPVVEKAVANYQPDVLVVDQHALAGVLAAERHGLPWVTLASSSLEIAQPFSKMPKVQAWISGLMAKLWAEAGLPAGAMPDLRFSPHLVIAFTARAMTGELVFPEHFALVGPALSGRPAGPDFPWDWLDPDRRHVLVTVGTMAENNATDSTNFYARAVGALRPLGDRVQGIVIGPPDVIPDPPEHIVVASRVPLLELMPRLDAVVCHGGLNTVCEALSCGVPLVIAPLTRDQPINAAQVVAAGAGIRVKFGRVSPDQLRTAVLSVLDDPRFRVAARRLAEAFAAAGGAAEAARRIELLLDAMPEADQDEPTAARNGGGG